MAPTYPIVLDFDPPQPQNPLSVFFRLFYLIPHAIILGVLAIAGFVVIVIAWFAILFTGSFPAGMYRFTVGINRWSTRVLAYGLLLTDKYPPFSLDDDAAYPARFAVADRLT